MNLFKKLFSCKHNFIHLSVYSKETIIQKDKDFTDVQYSLFCKKCGQQLSIRYSRTNEGVDKFLKHK